MPKTDLFLYKQKQQLTKTDLLKQKLQLPKIDCFLNKQKNKKKQKKTMA